jgi:3-methyladenine DNA glycosylase Mpg
VDHNGLDVLDPVSALQVYDDGYPVPEVLVTARIGIHVAIDLPLRFALPGHPCVSGAKNLKGVRVLLA